MGIKKNIVNQFDAGLWMDSISEHQPPNTYSFALNAVQESTVNSSGLINESSLEFIASINEGFTPRGWMDIPDKNKFIIASYNPKDNISEIGFINRQTKEYTKYFNDKEWAKKINFGLDNKIEFSFYVKGDCTNTHIQWAACKTYYVLNIDEPFCDIQYSDILLFDCNCAGVLKTQVIPKDGVNLLGGAYWVIARFTDVDNNHTNWYWPSNQSNLKTKNNAPGEVSRDALRITIPQMDSRRYDYIELAIIRRVGGIFEVKKIPKFAYHKKKQIYNLQSEQDFELENITIDSIFQKEIGWIRGDGITAKEGHSVLYNTYNNPNYDIQAVADKIKVKWVAYLCPISEAHKYQVMPRNEVVPLGIRRNYCDGNYSSVGHIKGRKANSYDLEIIPSSDNGNCSLCNEPRWKVENTATVTNWFCGDPFPKSEESALKPVFNIGKSNHTLQSSDDTTSSQPTPGSVLQGVPIRDKCSGTCTNSCGILGCCCNGVSTTCKGSANSGCSSCSGSCSGGGCSGNSFQGTGVAGINEEITTEGIVAEGIITNCNANITLYTNPDFCIPCRNLENSGILEQIGPSLPDYTVSLTKVKNYGPGNSMPEMYVECNGAQFRVSSLTLSGITSAIKSKCVCQETYNCDYINGCTAAGKDGEYASYNDCYNACEEEKTKKKKYGCDAVSGKCKQDDAGAYGDLLTCGKNCTITAGEPYACKSGKCVKDPSGTYTSLLNCLVNCESADTKKHSCTENGCEEDPNGIYEGLSACLAACDPNGKGKGGGGCGGGCGGGGCHGGGSCGGGCGGGCGGTCGGAGGGCNSCKNNGCDPTGCPKEGCDTETASLLACPPGDNCAEVIDYGGLYPLEGMDIPNLVCCLKLPCEEYFYKWMDLKITIPWSINSELDVKAQLIRFRDGRVLDLRKTPVYYPPDIEFKKETYDDTKIELPLVPVEPKKFWQCNTDSFGFKECIPAAKGFATKEECVKFCPGAPQHYKCDSGGTDHTRCIGGFTDGFPSYKECVKNCPGVIIDSGFECTTLYGIKGCYATGNGDYDTQEECLANSDCGNNDPGDPNNPVRHACISGKCVKDPNGPYTSYNDCYRVCEGGSGPRLNCPPVPIYDDSGCMVIGYDLPVYAEGELGYWQSEETYPFTKKCENEYMYGEDAGLPIRFGLWPSADIIPTHISFQNGVPHNYDPANKETNDTYIILLGIRIDGIEKIDKEVIPGCKESGWTIMMPKLDSTNSRVIANGLAVNTFLIDNHGQKMATPNYGVNSLERFSPFNKIPDDTARVPHRGGNNNDTSSYCFFSPDTLYKEEPLNVTAAHAQLEIFGQGFNYGDYVEGEHEEKFFKRKENEKGGRASINLNHYDRSYQKVLVTSGYCEKLLTTTLHLEMTKPNVGLWNFGFDIPNSDIAKVDLKVFFNPTLPDILLQSPNNYFSGVINYSKRINHIFIGVQGTITTKEGCIYKIGVSGDVDVSLGDVTDIDKIDTFYATNKRDPKYKNQSVTTCVKDAQYASPNSIMPKGDSFTYPLNNLYRERSVFFENYPTIDGRPIFYALHNGIDKYLSDGNYNGNPAFKDNGLQANLTCDGSFMGFAKYPEYYIFNAAGHYITLLRHLPKQHGTLENIQYKEFYTLTEEETICGQVIKPIGINYVGQFSIKRHAFITDRVGSDVSKGSWVNDLFGIINCGFVPTPGASNDPRNVDNMRPGDYWNGSDQFAGHLGIHKWYPNIQTTNVTFVVESKVNLHLLQLGEEAEPFNEIIYPTLKSNTLDANFPQDSNPRTSWLNRYRWKMHEPSAFEKLLMILVTILKILLLIYIFAQATAMTLTSVIAYVNLALALTFLGALFVLLTNERLMQILGYKDCRADQDGGPSRGDMIGWHDLHDLYNTDYTKDLIGRGVAVNLAYNLCPCYEELNGRIYWSSKQLVSSNGDAFRHFKINNFIELPSNWGKLQRIIHFGNRMWFQTSDAKWNSQFGNLGIELGEARFAQLGTGKLFSEPYNMYGDIKEGFSGTIDPGAAITCFEGDFSIDRKSRRIFQFTGQDRIISDVGVREFLQENLEIFVVRDFPDFPAVSEAHSIGFSMGIDHRLNRLLITKVDYECKNPKALNLVKDLFYEKETGKVVPFTDTNYWINKTFTISYSLRQKASAPWISFHSYTPSMYLWDRYEMFSFHNNSLYKHGVSKESFQIFYKTYYPFIISCIARGANEISATNFTYDRTRAVLKNLVWDDRSKSWRKANKFFDYVGIVNNYQSSNMQRVAIGTEENRQKGKLMVTPVDLQYEFSQLQNVVSNNKDISEILEVCNFYLPNMLQDFATFEKDSGFDHDRERYFYDEFLKYTFVKFDINDANVQMILRHVITKVTIDVSDS